MSRALVFGGSVALIAVAVMAWRTSQASRETTPPFEPPSRVIEPAALCPWREPDADLRRFFPEATRYATETRILSGLRVELTKQLGRAPDAEESTLTLHRVFQNSQPTGAVLTRRVKGEHGAIELVLAVAERGAVRGVHLQRLREPEAVASAVKDDAWLARFVGRTYEHGWDSEDVNGLASEARVSAHAIREGIRSSLILLAASDGGYASSAKPHH